MKIVHIKKNTLGFSEECYLSLMRLIRRSKNSFELHMDFSKKPLNARKVLC